MLIAAQPKSASTSLYMTLLKYTNLREIKNQVTGRRLKPLPLFKSLPHRCIKNYPKHKITQTLNKQHLYRLHLPPTSHNVNEIVKQNGKVIVTLREPDAEASLAYLRHKNVDNSNAHKNFNEERMFRIRFALNYFYNEWLYWTCKHPSNFLLVRYENLISDPEEINRCLTYWGYKPIKKPILLKKRYSK